MSHRSPLSNPRGFTLIELLVAITLFSMVSLGMMTFMVNIGNGYRFLDVQSTAAVDSSNSLGRIAKVLRGSTEVVEALPASVTVFAYFSPNDAVVDKVKYYLEGTNLKVSVIPPTGVAPTYTYNPADEKITSLRTNITNITSIFKYYDDIGTELTGTFNESQVKQIGIAISVNPNTKVLRKSLSNQTTVTLRNKKTNL